MDSAARYQALESREDRATQESDWQHLLSRAGVCGDASFLEACHPDVAAVYTLWDKKRRGGRTPPSRADFDPLEIPTHLLPGILLIDVRHDPLRFRYRLVGTRDVKRRGMDPTGLDVTEGHYGPNPQRALQTYSYVSETGGSLYRSDSVTDGNGIVRSEERLFLPLSTDGSTVDMILAFVVW